MLGSILSYIIVPLNDSSTGNDFDIYNKQDVISSGFEVIPDGQIKWRDVASLLYTHIVRFWECKIEIETSLKHKHDGKAEILRNMPAKLCNNREVIAGLNNHCTIGHVAKSPGMVLAELYADEVSANIVKDFKLVWGQVDVDSEASVTQFTKEHPDCPRLPMRGAGW